MSDLTVCKLYGIEAGANLQMSRRVSLRRMVKDAEHGYWYDSEWAGPTPTGRCLGRALRAKSERTSTLARNAVAVYSPSRML